MKVSVIGTGYVGLVTATCFSFLGHEVFCLDINEERINLLNQGKVPIYEPYLEDLLAICKENNNYPVFSTDPKAVIPEGDFIFIAVGTPPKADGEPNLSYLQSAAETIGQNLKDGAIVINKSTVPVGSGNWVAMLVENGIAMRANSQDSSAATMTKVRFSVASNPEFLREGCAISDSLYPDRVVLGCDNKEDGDKLKQLYQEISEQSFKAPDFCPRPQAVNSVPVITTDVTSAEMIKYSANSFLAMKISFANQIANICDLVGADVNEVMNGIGSDDRIGRRFLNAGIGWGGSCFGKDVDALIKIAQEYGYEPEMLKNTKSVNYKQRDLIIKRLQEQMKIIKGKKIALLGLAFKPNTDDLRDAPALDIAAALLKLGAQVRVIDPIAMPNAQKQVPDLAVDYCDSVIELVTGVDALVLVTEWDEYKKLDMAEILTKMNANLFIDGRNQYDPATMKELGFNYIGIGRSA